MNQAIRCLVAPLVAAMCSVAIAADKPNILVIWGDDVGWENVSAYGMGVMGYTTPNLDSIGMGGYPLHRSLCAAFLHGGTRRLYHGAVPDSFGHDDGRSAR